MLANTSAYMELVTSVLELVYLLLSTLHWWISLNHTVNFLHSKLKDLSNSVKCLVPQEFHSWPQCYFKPWRKVKENQLSLKWIYFECWVFSVMLRKTDHANWGKSDKDLLFKVLLRGKFLWHEETFLRFLQLESMKHFKGRIFFSFRHQMVLIAFTAEE